MTNSKKNKCDGTKNHIKVDKLKLINLASRLLWHVFLGNGSSNVIGKIEIKNMMLTKVGTSFERKKV